MYTVTFVYNNGEENQIISVERGKTISQPSKPQKDNYEFEYWCTDSSLKNKFDFSEGIYGNIALFAKYRSLLCTITFVNNNGSSNFSVSVLEGNTVSKPNNPIKENYLFDCWCTDSSLTNEYDFSKYPYNDNTKKVKPKIKPINSNKINLYDFIPITFLFIIIILLVEIIINIYSYIFRHFSLHKFFYRSFFYFININKML